MAARDPRTVGARIEALLEELGGIADPTVRDKAEEVARLLVELYGTGLERVVAALHAAGPPGEEILGALTGDELVGSLLMLHGLHPRDVETRVRQALDQVRPYLGSHSGGVELLGVDAQGVVRLRLEGSCSGCPSSTLTVRLAIEQAIEEAAPEVTRVEVEGGDRRAGPRTAADPTRPPDRSWTPLDLPDLPAGTVTAREIGNVPLVLCRLATGWYAYRNGCPGCGSTLGEATLAGEVLTCPGCGRRYDTRLAGRSVDGQDLHLDPIPLLAEGGTARVALPQTVTGARP
ncbi:hypothetical protein TR74_20965 [Carbonactinospora thermoautotrophica]|uniref:Rieske domain-containing protein n=1 Tax=Carbonactinospora thermoautotrophica TaxID=1469144 RepID=A0A132N9D2_9ACTN|nr:NifU family protein [Carbonactinospora thermoautotrophica]KWX06765.1 hypothetical protein TR74_20965 [Carbonactinospora thermoautotrophica]